MHTVTQEPKGWNVNSAGLSSTVRLPQEKEGGGGKGSPPGSWGGGRKDLVQVLSDPVDEAFVSHLRKLTFLSHH